jgi:hypothetical protein
VIHYACQHKAAKLGQSQILNSCLKMPHPAIS